MLFQHQGVYQSMSICQSWKILPNLVTLVIKSLRYPSSVTRFGEILPLWQNSICLRQCYDGLFSIWQNCEPTLVNFLCCWANIQRYKGPKIERIILPSGHTVPKSVLYRYLNGCSQRNGTRKTISQNKTTLTTTQQRRRRHHHLWVPIINKLLLLYTVTWRDVGN